MSADLERVRAIVRSAQDAAQRGMKALDKPIATIHLNGYVEWHGERPDQTLPVFAAPITPEQDELLRQALVELTGMIEAFHAWMQERRQRERDGDEDE